MPIRLGIVLLSRNDFSHFAANSVLMSPKASLTHVARSLGSRQTSGKMLCCTCGEAGNLLSAAPLPLPHLLGAHTEIPGTVNRT